VKSLKVLHAYNQHRGGGGANNATQATIEASRKNGLNVQVFTRSSSELPHGIVGRVRAGMGMVFGGQSVKQFVALMENFRPDIVHVHELFPLVSPWILPQCTRRGIPVVMSCVDYRMTCPVFIHLYKGKICNRCVGGHEYWAILRNCRKSLPESAVMAAYSTLVRTFGLFSNHVSRFIAPSDFAREWLIQNARIPPRRITTIAPSVKIPERPADPAAGTYVAFAGRFAQEKGIQTFAEAARLSGLPFRMARHVNSLVTADLPREVEVVVTHNREELDAFYRGARVLVLPSIWFETFGLTGAEALSHAIPVVASHIGAISSLIEDGEDGLYFEPGNACDLTEKVKQIWNDPEACRRLGRAGRQKAISLWRAERHFERLKAVYDEVCA